MEPTEPIKEPAEKVEVQGVQEPHEHKDKKKEKKPKEKKQEKEKKVEEKPPVEIVYIDLETSKYGDYPMIQSTYRSGRQWTHVIY